MKINQIVVTAGRTFNHPHEQYSNLRPEVVLTASLEEGEDAAGAVKSLQAQAEGLVEDHKNAMLKSIEELYELNTKAAEVRGLATQIRSAQSRLDDLRKAHPELKLVADLQAAE